MYGGFDVFKTYLAVKNHFTTDYDYNNMVVELQQNLKVLLKGRYTSFINYLKDIMNEIYWIILLLILLLTVINGLVIYKQ